MTSVRLRRRLLPVAIAAAAVLALAACGSDDSSSSDTTSTTRAASSSSKPATLAVVKTADNATLGRILVDAEGRTVYTLTKDGAAVDCTGGCLGAWPPVLLPSGTTEATGGPGVSKLTVVTTDAGEQVASDGLPLYTFAGDAAAGDAKGEGIESFGGVWKVVKVGGTASSSTTDDDDGGTYDY